MTAVGGEAERLQAILGRMEAGGPAADLAASGGADAELASLASLAGRLSATLPAVAPPAFRARLQTELQAQLRAQIPSPARARHGRWFRRRLVWRLAPRLVAALAAVVLVLASAVVVSADSLPGEPLYPVKRAVEGARLALTSDPDGRARVRLAIADSRLWEVRQLAEHGLLLDASLVEDVVAAHRAAVRDASVAGAELAANAAAHAVDGAEVLDGLAPQLAFDVRSVVRDAALQLREAAGVAPTTAQPSPQPPAGPSPVLAAPLTTPDATLTRAAAGQATPAVAGSAAATVRAVPTTRLTATWAASHGLPEPTTAPGPVAVPPVERPASVPTTEGLPPTAVPTALPGEAVPSPTIRWGGDRTETMAPPTQVPPTPVGRPGWPWLPQHQPTPPGSGQRPAPTAPDAPTVLSMPTSLSCPTGTPSSPNGR